MLRWRRRNDGFEWREYVRTTILVRRKDRKQRVKNYREAAVDQLKEKGRDGLSAGRAGAVSLGRGALGTLSRAFVLLGQGTRAGAASLARFAYSAGHGLSSGGSAIGRSIGDPARERLATLLDPLRRPAIEGALKLVAPLATLAAGYRAYVFGIDADVAVVATIAALSILLLAGLHLTASDREEREQLGLADRIGDKLVLLPGFAKLYPRQATFTAAALLAALAGGVWLYGAGQPGSQLAARSQRAADVPAIAAAGSSVRLVGRATAAGGATLRLSGTTLTLDGIEAPERDQTCTKEAGGTYRCGEAAKSELARLLRGQRITCDVTDTNDDGRKSARCYSRGDDIAEKLVQAGYAFAREGFFAAYSGAEADARNAKRGLWAGKAERPAEYRTKKWEEAKRISPDGCPIKGRISSGIRVYVLPWAQSYESLRVTASKGERWFCSEEEAKAAGFRAQS